MPKFLDVTNPAFARRALAAAGVDNSPSGLAATAAALGAHLYVDYNAGIYQRDGLSVSAASAIMHNTPTYTLYSQTRTYPYLNLTSATTNTFPVGVGGSAGPVDTVGALYDDWTIESPSVLPVGVEIKNITAGGEAFDVEFTVTLDAYTSGAESGVVDFVSPDISGCDTPHWLSFVVNAEASDLDSMWFEIGWDSDFGGSVASARQAGGGGRITLALPAGSATDNLRIRIKNASVTSELAARIQLREFCLRTNDSGTALRRDVPPVATSSLDAQDVTVNVDPGDYYVFAWTDERGIVGEPVTVAGSSFSLRSAVGCGRVTKIAVWKQGDYVDGAVEALDPPVYLPVGKFDTALLERTADNVTSAAMMAYSGPSCPAFLASTNRFGRSKVVITPGQHDPLSQLRQCRAEVIGKPYAHGVDLWTSFAFKTDALMAGLNAGAGSYALIWQWHDGYERQLSPALYLLLWPNGTLGLWTISTTDPEPVSQPAVLRWQGQTNCGQWNRIVMRANLSRSGGGQLGFWFNGANVYPWQNTPVGHNQTNVRPQYGYYGVNGFRPVTVERANMEFGTRSLSSRITDPLPI